MTYKELKPLLKGLYYVNFDYDILCDFAEKARFDPMNERIYEHYGSHEAYLEDRNIELVNDEPISIMDPAWENLERMSDDNFIKDISLDRYTVDKIEADDEYGMVVYLVHE